MGPINASPDTVTADLDCDEIPPVTHLPPPVHTEQRIGLFELRKRLTLPTEEASFPLAHTLSCLLPISSALFIVHTVGQCLNTTMTSYDHGGALELLIGWAVVTSCLAFNTVLASRGASMDDAHHRYESLAHKADEERSRRAEHMRQLEYIRYGCTPN